MNKLIEVFTLLPSLITAIRAAEDAIPLPQAGKAKLDLIMGIVDDVAQGVGDLKPILTSVISRVVKTFNALGLFRTSAA